MPPWASGAEQADQDDRGQAGAGRQPLPVAEPEDQQGDDDRAAADAEEAAEDRRPGCRSRRASGSAVGGIGRDTRCRVSRIRSGERGGPALLAPLRADPPRAAILTDVDGTLAPIVERPEQAAVPARGRASCSRRLSERYGLVGCISGRRAEEARRLVGVEGIAYAGNHGLELLLPGDEAPRLDPSLRGARAATRRDVRRRRSTARRCAGPGCGWRTRARSRRCTGAAPTTSAAAEARAHEIAAERRAGRARAALGAQGAGAAPGGRRRQGRRGRARCSPPTGSRAAAYAGDDRTDLDAFRRLRELREEGELETAVCVGVVSDEGAAGAGRGVRPDASTGRDGLAGDPRVAGGAEPCPTPTCCALTVFLTAAEATALGAITAIAAGRDDDPTTLARRRRLVAGRARRSASTSARPAARRRRRPRRPRPGPHRHPPARGVPGADRRSAASGRSASTALVAGVLGIFFPGVAAIGAGYALLVALAWRTREAAVLGIEQRDGVKFYVVPNSALRPIELVRTPGLRSRAGPPRRAPERASA